MPFEVQTTTLNYSNPAPDNTHYISNNDSKQLKNLREETLYQWVEKTGRKIGKNRMIYFHSISHKSHTNFLPSELQLFSNKTQNNTLVAFRAVNTTYFAFEKK